MQLFGDEGHSSLHGHHFVLHSDFISTDARLQQELEMLRDQLVRLQNHIILLKEELHSVLYSSTSTTGLFNYCVLSLVVLLVLC